MRHFVRTSVVTLALVGLVVGSTAWYLGWQDDPVVSFRTAKVERGNLVATISATGTLEPEEVDRRRCAGRRADPCLRQGQERQDDRLRLVGRRGDGAGADRRLAVRGGRGVVEGVSRVGEGGRTVRQGQSRTTEGQTLPGPAGLGRAQKLGPSDALSQADYDSYESAYEIAKANVTAGEAAIVQAQRTVDQAQANLDRSQRNLSYCTIKSPVQGVIIDRRVNIGQTVVSSLNAPSLFLIAKDLKRIEVWVAVNEADIGSIHPGQDVTFTVDAFPGQTFHGKVSKVRLNASMTQNVVTYTVEVITDNPDGKLLPYLTANVQFITSRDENVLLVPNAALRWIPDKQQIAPDASAAATQKGTGHRPGRTAASQQGAAQTYGTVWTPEGDFVRPIHVRVGPSDGTMTDVAGKGLTEGTPVVLGMQTPQAGGSEADRNPFTPQFGRARRSAQQGQQHGQ